MSRATYLRGLVERAAQVYRQNPKVKAIALVGSAALGMVDSISDTDTTIYYEEVPTEDEVRAAHDQIMDRFGAYYWQDEKLGYGEYYFVNNVKMDFGHVPIDFWEQEIDEVLVKHSTEPIKQKPLSGMMNAIPLYGEALVEGWRARIAEYPDALALKMIQENLRFRPFWVIKDMAAGRGDVLWYREEAVTNTKNMLGVLLGLNKLYHPVDYKHLDWCLGQMSIAPERLAARVRRVMDADALTSAAEMGSLIDETFDLVRQHRPEVDADARQERFHMPTMAWEMPEDNGAISI